MLAALSLVWGYSWVTNKIGILLTSPFDFAAMRVVVGAIGMFLLMLIQGRSIRFQHGKYDGLGANIGAVLQAIESIFSATKYEIVSLRKTSLSINPTGPSPLTCHPERSEGSAF